ncbi:phenylalanine--tRNA ligase subunit alpha [Clostridium cochlearium]|jgi:phenylalanyl-tRNA synthetase alpha chain|uniref:Phenylalanine--tRNA ligase alpha subunit n=1 Tax=Clostridium cochlearium TaxID=1494 RepID=A0A240AT28_CLOCO|nr:phenylalanine--tRNA ligase subunit alpha [Clostridium cochlearium]MBV1820644.1 phenylalanine--tRNA ligase subunit alpha [Bacteroidales bacterium MSK.15.36]NSJ91707.1 phenylalanine--tRNA ligase subunit alpha [Coprococcus sp. MSK.21.13]MBU5268281.1 phenylalanine--tRNA ligase subunit alpha [Clostridium cochlearium]MCG4571839.1 phenylalanine--tRNA ligase subunit alpha [Clostridium cochlearium]MCR1970872.1 phenylalanine--tRNA ligase subunit alpha [Clostridium cochlearium]
MKEVIEKIKKNAIEELNNVVDKETIESIRVKYLGKKGELTKILRGMGGLSPEERPIVGKLANEVRKNIEEIIEVSLKEIKEKEKNIKLSEETIDITLPGKRQYLGKRHPLEQTLDAMKEIFTDMGFTIEEGPEIELDYYNFEALNIPKNHPARGEQDTFYINDSVVLRTQTSPIQIRTMENQKPPIKMIAPGKVYRSDSVDATHSPIFYQMEGLVVDKGITFADLKGTLEMFGKKMFGEDLKTKFRPHHFPFTEPSAEMDATCFVCHGEGCKICKGEGWIEILGGGMVHPQVLKNCGIDPEVYSGFAFGFGVDRMVMQKYGIDDIRLLYESDMRFLNQF